MAGTVTMGGLGSGMDIEGLVAGLVKANGVTLTKLQNQAASFRSAASTLSDIGSTLATLQTAVSALSTTTGVGGITATSSDAAVVVSANGAALPASYEVSVDTLASEQRTYSQQFGSNSGALGQAGNFTIKLGSGTPKQIAVLATDSLDQIAGKINQAGIRASASVFFDGSKYRLQVRGLDTGADNGLTFVENGTTLDLNGDGSTPTGGKTVQQAKNAKLTVDGFDVERSTNQIVGVVPGVTFALTAKTTSAAKVSISSDPKDLQTKLTAVVNAFNGVVKAAHTAAGYGGQAAKVDALAGDFSLRAVTNRLNAAITAKGATTGAYQTLQDVGLSLDRNGLLTLDTVKLSKAMTADSATVVNLMARTAGVSTGGIMAKFSDDLTKMTDPLKGLLTTRNQSLTKQAKKIDDRVVSEQARLNAYSDKLRKSLGDMDAKVGADKVMLQALSNTFSSFYR
jgi:flagellar hook-associated protein 2